MFCFQCEQTFNGEGCTKGGVCGKKADTADLQDELTGQLIGLARACGTDIFQSTYRVIEDGLFMSVTNVNFDNQAINRQIEITVREKKKYLQSGKDCASSCGIGSAQDMDDIWGANEDVRSLKSLLLFGLRGMAAYAHHSMELGKQDPAVNEFFVKGLVAVGEESEISRLLDLCMELGNVNLQCMELLDRANTGAYGTPQPTKVSCNIEPGPFIVVTGHDLLDLKRLLEQTEGKGVNIYTHGEMLPAHGYPQLRQYAHLKGNFGTAWQSQQREFDSLPAPVLFTTNCLMPPKASYSDRVFTTSVVGYPEMIHIGEDKDFSQIINKALALGGYREKRMMTGINGGDTLITGFGHGTVLSAADKVVSGVKSGKIKHFFLVGGCDGASPGRNYYTDFVKKTPADTIILTLACGKYRFNDLDLGSIEGLPRIMDMGQCNDAYSAIRVAVELSKVFECTVNELPLTLVLSWYEQKAVCILLTLLALGIKNIFIGPSIPAFLSPEILNVLVKKWNLTPISTPEEDLRKIIRR